MDEANLAERTIAAPTVLDLASRDRFQRAAIALLDEMPRGSGYLTVDLTEIHCLDASVLSALAVIQQRAADYGLAIRLKNASAYFGVFGHAVRLMSDTRFG